MNVKILRNVLETNDAIAAKIRARLAERKIAALNLIGGAGSGKTTLLEKTIPALSGRRVAVIEGDIAGARDAERIARLGVPAIQLNTGGACHLEAALVERGLGELDLAKTDLIFIENVGNIACPAEFDLGETAKVAVLSVAEGHDKPSKYPLLFHEAAALVLTKTDLLPHVDFEMAAFLTDFRKINARAPVLKVSARTGEGMAEWLHWIEHAAEGDLHVPPHAHAHPHSHGVPGVEPHQHPHRSGRTSVSSSG
ncbi:MAG: hydrogenase nickel incorporation protein HypB [Verrucomicrobiae bacterium]|nr:hydrogenase nickel incorporation protein HypB [Verrucomicrobiae bacterium]